MSKKKDLIVIGNGMVGHKFIENMVLGGFLREWNITTFCEEPRLAYDRVNLSAFFSGKSAADLSMVKPGLYEEAGVHVLLGDKAVAIDRQKKCVTSAKGETVYYDKLVLATGSYPFVPPIKGRDTKGCFVYRTIEDLEAMQAHAKVARVGVVVGGGLLGLEAANALKNMGLETHVVEFAPRLMALQVDEAGGMILRRKIEELGVEVHTNMSTTEIVAERGRVARMLFADQSELATDMIVFSAGIRPRDELARKCELALGNRGGVAIDQRCQTSDPDILAIGECASFNNQLYGLVAPGYHMARVAVDALTGGQERFGGFDMSTKLKLMGVDVASFGDAFAAQPGARVISFMNATSNVYKKLVVSADGELLLGGIMVGDASNYGQLLQLVQNKIALPPHPEDLIVAPRDGAKPAGLGVEALPDSATICSCLNVTKKTICSAICDDKLTTVAAIKGQTKAGTGCGSCTTLITDLLKKELKKAGVAVNNHICEHFGYSRQELYHLIRIHEIRSFDDLLARHGKGKGCEICKPAVASILASTWNEHILSKRHLPLQDTNDRFMANVQRDGTYSVVPRVAGGEITPEQLIALGQVAKKYNLYSKITGGQRVDLFGARLEQLPDIWAELIAAGFESGHAYGKALRTVKSCVGSTWCRYGVQDSVGFAITLENRYKGLRSPHKLKSAVSGCARECAEAQGKDFGIIATEKGYNLYLCGNGGMKPQHAQLFAADLDEATVIKYLDRFLMFYIRTADKLQRTATWFNNLEGGMDYLKQVVIEDSLGICEELERDMAHVIATYECEWKAAISDPEKLKQFRPFVNAREPDRSIVFVSERAQHRPAAWKEKATAVEEMI
ncbi:nitrite reductase [Sorangium cellulosum]|uniref:Nitrite reductase n=1 Tax=Sorangium cellulosum TaxID=56 RepID=A0A4P2QCR4_SORCE|nr:nitrite reductase large subunit NirB [Sorangium cellulosum]AUX27191.1 nitrite reductase [Sorangium cellulosum]